MSCILVVVNVGFPGNIVILGNRLVPTPEPVQPLASSRGSLDPPLSWVLGSGARAASKNGEPGLTLALNHSEDCVWFLQQTAHRQQCARPEGTEATRGF